MPLCGGLTIGVDNSEPYTPPLRDRERAAWQLFDLQAVSSQPRAEKSAMVSSISAKLIRSASRSTGTTSPLPPPTAMPIS